MTIGANVKAILRQHALRSLLVLLPAVTVQAQEPATGTDDDIEEVIVTGSRITRSGFDMPTPMTVLGREAIENSGRPNIDDALLRLPQVALGQGAQNAMNNIESGAAFINLRGLGTNRSLVVVNGRRRVSGSSTQSAVDLNTIPAAMIERVDLITGGTSAVYGADAVTGVVNVITKKNFDGLETSLDGGISDKGDAETYTFSLAGGTKFGEDRGSIGVGASYTKSERLAGLSRDFSDHVMSTAVNPNDTGPSDGVFDNITLPSIVSPIESPNGYFEIGGIAYTLDPQAREFENELDVDGFTAIGTDGRNFADQLMLRPEQEILSVRANLDYEIVPGANLFLEGEFANTDTVDTTIFLFDLLGSIYPDGLVILRENPLLPASVTALMDAAGQSQVVWNGVQHTQGQLEKQHERTTYTVAGGLEGNFADSWNWTAFYQYGDYQDNVTQINTRKNQEYLNAVDAIADPVTGEPVCRSAAARASGCVPIQIFGSPALTQAQRSYLFYDKLSYFQTTQSIAGLQLTGKPFDLPAGALGLAVGVEYRDEDLRMREDGLWLQGGAFPFPSGFTPTDAEQDVSEAYAEVLVPLLKDKPLAQRLDVEVAGRYSDYSTIGTTTAWKFGANWSPVEDVRLRATRSNSVRAPNLIELFGPVAGSPAFTDDIDPCRPEEISQNSRRPANCQALGMPAGYNPNIGDGVFEILSGGNPSLTEETADSWTVGLVLTPRFAPGLSLSVDYWTIEIEGAVGALSAEQVLQRCVDSETINNIFCAQHTRGPAFFITSLDSRAINIGSLVAEGIDIGGDYRFDLSDNSALGFNLNATYLIEHERQIDASDPTTLDITLGEALNPRWRANFDIRYSQGNFSGILSTRYFASVKEDVQYSPEFLDENDIPSKIYNDLIVRYQYSDSYQATLGVNNLFDVTPPDNNATVYNGRRTNYDAVGRFIHLGLSAKF